ncbi:hypothetical protein H072_5644 [Dactylellina haptotyla CBS 200.50]|uniref:1,3-beta-glucanosyltransferase n=1 Tax=Dactylellina haptotyla (strain CBS 200.50) TaxID=1284197 RepID=S8AC60_DACHA|nr:hypothetical protein H072_5644 [Dactylellina haptotyla CBS 200.50]
MRFSTLVGLASVVASTTALTPITIKGNAFFSGSDRFYIRGVDYQPGGASNPKDPLADTSICGRDIPALKELGVNAVRVYIADSAANHDACMKMLEDAGIYLILDVTTPTHSITRTNPGVSYNEVFLQHVFSTMDVFSKYSNVLAFFAGNEVVNRPNTTRAATYVKASIRDMKAYQKARKLRAIPIGYSATDVTENRLLIAQYMNSGAKEERVDFHAFNDYTWCGEASSFEISGYDQKVKDYIGYGIPVFLSEFGCNKNPPRTFPEIAAIYDEKMTGVFSGGLVYEWSQEPNNFGLVQVSGDLKNIKPLIDYENLKDRYKKVPNPSGDGGATTTDGNPTQCPSKQSGIWEADCKLPAMPQKAETYLTGGAGQALGLKGPTNQWAGVDPPAGSVTESNNSPASSKSPNAASMSIPSLNLMAAASVVSMIFAGLASGVTLFLYWDWVDESSQGHMLPITLQPNVQVTTPDGKTAPIVNRFYTYNFKNNERSLLPGSRVGSEIVDRPVLADAKVVKALPNRTDDLYTALGASKTFADFRREIKNIHNDIHTLIAGFMTNPRVAAFDPIFWLHHNVDRMFAMWQAANPTLEIQPSVDKPSISYQGQVQGGTIGMQSRFLPFKHPDGSWWNSQDITSVRSIWNYGYGYPEVPCGRRSDTNEQLDKLTTAKINMLFKDRVAITKRAENQTVVQWKDNIVIDQAEIMGSFQIIVLGKDPGDYISTWNCLRISSVLSLYLGPR